MAKKNDNVDPMESIFRKADDFSKIYKNDPYWQALKAGCDAIRSGSVTQDALEFVKTQRSCQGPLMTNHKVISLVLEKIEKLDVT